MLSTIAARRLLQRNQSPDLRYYHATQRKEILPIIAGLTILFVGRYSYKALRRMEDEWDEYEWRLQHYEKKHGVVSEELTKKYPDGTIGIDVGTFHLKLAKDKPGVLVNREGGRYTFAGIVVDDVESLVGDRAFEKYWERPGKAFLAGQTPTHITTVVPSALDDALARANADPTKVRPIVTSPPLKWDDYEAAFLKLFPDEDSKAVMTMVPEPVAAIWGAQTQKELPEALETPVLVIDVGALETTLSVVQKNVILSTTTIDTIGADLYVQAIVDQITDAQETLKNDPMALQRVYMAAHTAVAELNTQTNAQLHIPYIGMNLETKEPEHLDERIARTVVEQKVTNQILTSTDESKLSTHMPAPTSLSFLWMSIMTKLLEVTDMTPMQLSHVLLVGGGAKHKLIQTSVQECFVTLQGNADNLVIPTEPSEVVALGAASMLQNYKYDATTGLVRDDA